MSNLGRAGHAPRVHHSGGSLARQRHEHLVPRVEHGHDESVVLHVVEVGRPHLLRQRAAPAEEPPGAVVHGRSDRTRAASASGGGGELVSLPHLRPPEAAVHEPAESQEHARGDHDVAHVRVVEVERRDAEDEERRGQEQREGEGVHVHVAQPQALHVPPEHAQGAARRRRAHRRVVAAVQQPAAPLRAAHHHATVVDLDLHVLLVSLLLGCPARFFFSALMLGRCCPSGRLVGPPFPAQRAVRGVEAGDDGAARPEAVPDVEGPVGAVPAGEAPEQGAAVVLRDAGDVEQRHHHEHVRAVAGARGAVLAVHLPHLVPVAAGSLEAPAKEQHEVVEDLGVLVQAHDGEERVQDLVGHLRPPLARLRLRDGAVQHARHQHQQDQQARSHEPEPHQHRKVRGLLAPARRVPPKLGPFDLPHERNAEPPLASLLRVWLLRRPAKAEAAHEG
ncbi:hypothetical protein PR202_gb19575 [Eleusine coracana subsp. coracana]|uniref:Uncharacterized protein n=1 Tax=Eleusine coracana subsp. coracana TaxID=191504 RepID=A0AAV5FA14_ELECO|nr:hypothetical protein PR202_gb19575 [Eleusine coracana subsp. coracana]